MEFPAALGSVTTPGDSKKPVKVTLLVSQQFADELKGFADLTADPEEGPQMTVNVEPLRFTAQFGQRNGAVRFDGPIAGRLGESGEVLTSSEASPER